MARGAGPSHLEGDFAGELEHLPMEEEEAREAKLGDQRQLLPQPGFRSGAQGSRRIPVAVLKSSLADPCELDIRGIEAVGEVRIAVAELLGEIELQTLGELGGRLHCAGVVGEAGGGLRWGEEGSLSVPMPFRLAGLQRDLVLHGHEHVLQVEATRMVRMRVTGRDRADSELPSEVAECGVAARVATGVRALQLDEEAVAAEGACEARGRVRIPDGKAEARVQTLVRVGGREQAAEVRVASRRLHEEGDMRAVGERRFRARDRLDADRLGGVSELERTVDAVVVGERERGIAELGRAHSQLFGKRGAVEEGVGRVGMELDVAHALRSARHPRAFQRYADSGWWFGVAPLTWRLKPWTHRPASTRSSTTSSRKTEISRRRR